MHFSLIIVVGYFIAFDQYFVGNIGYKWFFSNCARTVGIINKEFRVATFGTFEWILPWIKDCFTALQYKTTLPVE